MFCLTGLETDDEPSVSLRSGQEVKLSAIGLLESVDLGSRMIRDIVQLGSKESSSSDKLN